MYNQFDRSKNTKKECATLQETTKKSGFFILLFNFNPMISIDFNKFPSFILYPFFFVVVVCNWAAASQNRLISTCIEEEEEETFSIGTTFLAAKEEGRKERKMNNVFNL